MRFSTEIALYFGNSTSLQDGLWLLWNVGNSRSLIDARRPGSMRANRALAPPPQECH